MISKKLIEILERDANYVNKSIDLNYLDNSSILITGSSGLVGINLISAIGNSKKNITIHATSYSEPSKEFKEILNFYDVVFTSGDISDHDFVKTLPNVDFIIHCAGYGQPGKFLEDKLKTISINTTATVELSKKLNNGGSFLFISSSEIYSGCKDNLNSELEIGTTTPSHPRASYIEAKRTGETVINVLRELGYKASSARLALAYGPGVREGDARVLNQFFVKGIKGEINMLDSGQAVRTYCYISDVILMLLNILRTCKESEYNVGGRSNVTIRDLAKKICTLTNAKLKIPKDSSSLLGAPKFVGLDLSRIENEFQIDNFIDLDKGLKNTYEWMKIYAKK